jgi:hypothetical protein
MPAEPSARGRRREVATTPRRQENFDVARFGARGLALADAALGVEGGVDVLVDEREDVGLLEGDNVVQIEGLVAVRRAELLLEGDGLLGRGERVGRDLAQPLLAEGALEGQEDGDGEEVAERERRLVERLRERLRHGVREVRLRRLEAGEGPVELLARARRVVGQLALDGLEGARRNERVARHRPDGRPSDPHALDGSRRPRGRNP